MVGWFLPFPPNEVPNVVWHVPFCDKLIEIRFGTVSRDVPGVGSLVKEAVFAGALHEGHAGEKGFIGFRGDGMLPLSDVPHELDIENYAQGKHRHVQQVQRCDDSGWLHMLNHNASGGSVQGLATRCGAKNGSSPI
jgi:hypothetical protein